MSLKMWVDIHIVDNGIRKVVAKIGYDGKKYVLDITDDEYSDYMKGWYKNAEKENPQLKRDLSKAKNPYDYLNTFSKYYCGIYFGVSRVHEEDLLGDVSRK